MHFFKVFTLYCIFYLELVAAVSNPNWQYPAIQGDDDQWIVHPYDNRNNKWWEPIYDSRGNIVPRNQDEINALSQPAQELGLIHQGGDNTGNTMSETMPWWIVPDNPSKASTVDDTGAPLQPDSNDPRNNNDKWLWVQPPDESNARFWWLNVYGRRAYQG